MKDDSASYYDSREFTELLASYENMLEDGSSVYFDSMDIANIAEYYSINGELDKSDTAIEYGLRLHPSDSDILISKANNLLRRGLKAPILRRVGRCYGLDGESLHRQPAPALERCLYAWW